MAPEVCEGEGKSKEIGGSGGGFYYNSSNNNIQTQFTTNQIQTGFGSAGEPDSIFNHQPSGGGDEFHDHQNMMVVGPWGAAEVQGEEDNNNNRFGHLVDEDHESCLRSSSCVFPCEPNERPSQGLSLSLSSSNPSSIGLQSFELIRPQQQSPLAIFQLRSSKFLGPTQELLYEFCSLGISNNHQPQPHLCSSSSSPKHKGNGTKNWEFQSSLQSLDFMELQKRKTKLFSMLDEVERRYRHYCEQMKAVVASFEAVVGCGAARVYSALASKAMSRHFRCLKDGIVGQIEATKKAMGEKDPIAPGTTRGETPRLRVIDQALRQQRAFHQITIMETHPWRPQRGLPERSVSVLRAWLFEHFLHPYPSDVDKHVLARQTGLSRSQVSNWFINARVRLWKPMVEEMYLEETKEQEEEMIDNNNFNNSLDGMADFEDDEIDGHRSIPTRLEDQKPTPDQLLRIDSDCLSSIISNNSEKNDSRTLKAMQNHLGHHLHNSHSQTFGRVAAADAFGTVELDFSSYNHQSGSGGVSFHNNQNSSSNNQHFNNGSSGGVSLTLGLQQHAAAAGNGSGGVSIAFAPVAAAAAAQSSLFFTRDHMEECQPVQYSLLDGETQNLPYRNLMGAQLLHDLAG